MKDKKNQMPRTQTRKDGQRREKQFANVENNTLEDQCHPRKVFLGGLAHKTTTQHLRDNFGRFGSIVDAVVLRWPDGRSRGFGYVTFADASAAASMLQEKHVLHGREIDVKRAVPGTNKLFIGGLPQNATANELREHFEKFGIVSDAVVMIDPSTGRSRGFGFVCFLPGEEGSSAVASALEQYDNHRMRGKWIEVKSAAPPHKLDGQNRASKDVQIPSATFGRQCSEEISLAAALQCAGPSETSAKVSVGKDMSSEPKSILSSLGSPRKVAISDSLHALQSPPPGLTAPMEKPAELPWWTSNAWNAPFASVYGAFPPTPGDLRLPGPDAFDKPLYAGGLGLTASEGLQQSLEVFLRQTLQNKMESGAKQDTPSESTTCGESSTTLFENDAEWK